MMAVEPIKKHGTLVMRGLALNCINAFLLSVVLTLVVEKVAYRIGLVDVPSTRKIHEGPVPLVGGALFLAFGIAAMLVEQQPTGFVGFFIGLTLIVLLGVLDDLLDLRARVKFLAQIACVGLMVLSGSVLVWNLGTIVQGGPVILSDWAVPVTIIGVVGMINALNMIDGLDGLAGSIALVALLWFAAAAGMIGLQAELLLAMLVAFCILGFLVFNLRHRWRSRASVFLGDAGSMMLGAILAFLAIRLSQRTGPSLSPVAAVWICALPIIDTVSLAVRRLIAGQSPFRSDRQHLHYLLLETGLSVSQAVATLVAVSFVLGGIGVGGWYIGVPDYALLLGLGAPVGLHAWFSLYGWKHLSRRTEPAGPAEQPLGRPQPLLK